MNSGTARSDPRRHSLSNGRHPMCAYVTYPLPNVQLTFFILPVCAFLVRLGQLVVARLLPSRALNVRTFSKGIITRSSLIFCLALLIFGPKRFPPLLR